MWEQNIRLRHRCTRKYLCLDSEDAEEGKQWILTEDQSNRNAIFRLHRVVRDAVLEISVDSYARIQHAASGTWLHAIQQKYHLQQYVAAEGSKDPMDQLEWDGALLRRVGISQEARYDDAYALVPVPQEYVLDFNFVAGLVRPIEIFVRRAQTGTTGRTGEQQLTSSHYPVRARDRPTHALRYRSCCDGGGGGRSR